MDVGAGVDKLRVDAQMIARSLHTAFEEMCDAELLPDLPRVARFAGLVRTGRGSADYFRSAILARSERISSCISGRKVGVVLVVTQIFEEQYRDAFLGRRTRSFDFDAT